ncbi:MAG: hypothetical protein ACOCWO_04780, partial [Candidatus Muiribacteriaceae bacterium]
MIILCADEKHQLAAIYRGQNLSSVSYEKDYSSYNKYTVFAIREVLRKEGLNFADIDHFLFAGHNVQEFNAMLNLYLLQMYDHNNRKEIIRYEPIRSECYNSAIAS